MKPPAFGYHDPGTLSAAVSLLASLPNARILAGGQSLVPMLNMRVALPDHLVDINRIGELRGIRIEGDELIIGAMTRQRDLEFDPEVARVCPIIIEAIEQVGHRQTRNRGTIGGSLCHLDPAAELPSVAVALDASIEISSARGTRKVAIGDFALGSMTTCVEADEIVTAVRIPLWPTAHGYAFTEFARRHGDFAMAGRAVLLTVDSEGTISRCAIALAGVCEAPFRLRKVEQFLVGKRGGTEVFASAGDGLDGAELLDDIHAPASYRRRLAGVMVRRSLQAAFDRAMQR